VGLAGGPGLLAFSRQPLLKPPLTGADYPLGRDGRIAWWETPPWGPGVEFAYLPATALGLPHPLRRAFQFLHNQPMMTLGISLSGGVSCQGHRTFARTAPPSIRSLKSRPDQKHAIGKLPVETAVHHSRRAKVGSSSNISCCGRPGAYGSVHGRASDAVMATLGPRPRAPRMHKTKPRRRLARRGRMFAKLFHVTLLPLALDARTEIDDRPASKRRCG
jgi:hypothetical protein